MSGSHQYNSPKKFDNNPIHLRSDLRLKRQSKYLHYLKFTVFFQNLTGFHKSNIAKSVVDDLLY